MKRGMYAFLFGLAVFLMLSGPAFAGELKTLYWDVNGVKREALVWLPDRIEGAPVVFTFHGNGGVWTNFHNNFYPIEKVWPEAIVVCPRGLPSQTGLASWQASPSVDGVYASDAWESNGSGGWVPSSTKMEIGNRDFEFLDAMLETVRNEWKTGADHTYMTGYSQGGLFTHMVWALKGDEFAAVAPMASPISSEEIVGGLMPKPFFLAGSTNDMLVTWPSQVALSDAALAVNRWTGDEESKTYYSAYNDGLADGMVDGADKYSGNAVLTSYKSALGIPMESYYFPLYRAVAQMKDHGHWEDPADPKNATYVLMVDFLKRVDAANTARPGN